MVSIEQYTHPRGAETIKTKNGARRSRCRQAESRSRRAHRACRGAGQVKPETIRPMARDNMSGRRRILQSGLRVGDPSAGTLYSARITVTLSRAPDSMAFWTSAEQRSRAVLFASASPIRSLRHEVGEPIGAQEQAIPIAQLEMPDLHECVSAHRVGQDVVEFAGRRLEGSRPPIGDALPQGLVPRELPEHPVAKQVRARVPDMGDEQIVAGAERRRHRRPQAGQLGVAQRRFRELPVNAVIEALRSSDDAVRRLRDRS